MRTGFAQVDITPKPGQLIIGWIKRIEGHTVLDPLFAKAAIFDSGDNSKAAWIAFDALSVRWTLAQSIRRAIQEKFNFPADRIMVSATHTHAGAAVAKSGVTPRDEPYVQRITQAAIEAFAQAYANMQETELGIARGTHHALPRNRRVIMRDGTVKTHGNLTDPEALCIEGPVDPALTVFFARDSQGRTAGALVNFTCHPVHHGIDGCFSAGWPGAMCAALQKQGVPVTLFLNGAIGNVHHTDPTRQRPELNKDQAGALIAADVAKLIQSATDFRQSPRIHAAATTLSLPLRNPTPDQIHGTAKGAQRFIDPTLYDQGMHELLAKIEKARGKQPAEIQAIALDEFAFVSIPAEFFVELGLAIKEKCHPRRALIVGIANGMIGYVPTRHAFDRGGYETTFGSGSRMAPETGDMLVEAAVALVNRLEK